MSTSPITAAKNAQQYTSATARKRCATCDHKTNNYGADMLSCDKGKFLVTAYGVCPSWTLQQPPGFKKPTAPQPTPPPPVATGAA